LARELGVSLAKIKGTGQKGRILNEDLKSYVKQIVSHGDTDDEVEIVHSRESRKYQENILQNVGQLSLM